MLRSQNKFSVYSFAKVNTVRRRIAISLYLLMCNTHAFAAYSQHELKRDEYVQLQNSTAKTDVSGMAQVRVHAWVYERERRPGARTLFANYLGLNLDALSAQERTAFSARSALFLVDVQKNKRLVLKTSNGSKVRLQKTDRYGAVNELVALPMGDRDSLWQNYSVQGPHASFAGRALRVPNQGISIISDIDDTIRITNVLNKHEMLMNTFVRPLKAVPDMASLYQNAAARPAGGMR